MSKIISIVIPVFNSAATIVEAIQACLEQDYPKEDLQIIVVDDGSTDETPGIVQKFPVMYTRQENQGPAKARNTGWRQARGEIVCFTDADCLPEKDWVKKLANGYTLDAVGAVGGSYGIVNTGSTIAECVYQEIIYRHSRMPSHPQALGSYNLSVRRNVLEDVGGFNESYRMASGEDNDLSYKIRKKGYQLIFDKNALVLHYHPSKLSRYLRSQFWHGFWRVKLYQDHPEMMRGDNYSNIFDYLQPWISIVAILLSCFIFIPLARVIFLSLLLGQLFLQLPIAFGVFKKTKQIRNLLLIPITFLRAFARGLGMLLGIFRLMKFSFALVLFIAIVRPGFIPLVSAVEPPQQQSFDPRNMADIKKALEYLKQAYESNPSDQKAREELAKAYNYYAIQLVTKEGVDLAIDYMQKARDLCFSCEEYSSNLSMLYTQRGHRYYSDGNIPKARSDLKNAVSVFPKNASALLGLANIYYSDNNLPEAMRCWNQVLQIDPNNQEAAFKLSAVKNEIEKGKLFKTRETQNFSFMFEEELEEKQFGNIENILNEVYVKVGQDFNYFPTYKITVQIYSPAKYRGEVQSAQKVIGVYDGKIKLPADYSKDIQRYRSTVYHEYVHAIVYDLSGNRCPRWLHEGLAASEEPGFAVDAALIYELHKSGGLVKLPDLDSYFLDFNNTRNVDIAYNESCAVVKFFLQRFNFWHMKNILTNLKAGFSIDESFMKAIYMDTGGLFDRWKEEILKNHLPI